MGISLIFDDLKKLAILKEKKNVQNPKQSSLEEHEWIIDNVPSQIMMFFLFCFCTNGYFSSGEKYRGWNQKVIILWGPWIFIKKLTFRPIDGAAATLKDCDGKHFSSEE